MPQKEVLRERIASTFKALRKGLGLSQSEVVRRSGKTIGRADLSRIEKGAHLVSTVGKRMALARGFGLPVDVISALVEGRMTVEDAIAHAKDATPLAIAPAPAPSSPGSSPHLDGGQTFRRLELCLAYHAESGHHWRPDVVAAARSGPWGDEQTSPMAWKTLLDNMEKEFLAIDKRLLPARTLLPSESGAKKATR